MMVRGVMRRYRLDHLAVVASVAAQPGPQRRFVIGWAQKQQSGDRAAPSDPRLAKLVMVARREWDDPSRRTPAPMRLLFGRPWLLMLLLASLSIQLFFDLLRIPLVVSGRYSWLPMLPTQPANALFALYVGLLAATIVTLWRRSAIGYGLALWLSAAQLVHVFAFHETLLNTLWSLTVPALIWLCLVLLYLDARIRELEEEV